ncbi:Ig-like domain-containing protein [Candidatus Poriferisodalis sp.]|uniref:Ig-like domain-containing protein n=1 Tax=Candidatus Poriferisodalis sp. TaxID=3101277 RepID=UPI003B515EAD
MKGSRAGMMAVSLASAFMSTACDANAADTSSHAVAGGATVPEAGSENATVSVAKMGDSSTVTSTADARAEGDALQPSVETMDTNDHTIADAESERAPSVTSMVSVPASVVLTPGVTAFSALGQTAQIAVEVRDQTGRVMTVTDVFWSSTDTTVAAVDADGQVTAAGSGSATITATVGAISERAMVSVTQAVSSVAVLPATAVLTGLGATVQLTAEAFDQSGYPVAGAAIEWESSDAAVATADRGGLVTATGVGTATITGLSGRVSSTTTVTVTGLALSGTVSDARGEGLVVPCATVRLKGGTGEYVVTDADGRYRLSDVLGEVEITVTADPGYVRQTVPVTMDSGDRTLDFVLEHTGKPPYSGTVWITSDILGPSDPSSLGSVTYVGRGMRDVYDRRVTRWITVDAYLFEVKFGDRTVEFQVNPEFGSEEAARESIDTFAPAIGRLPDVLMSELREVEMNAGAGLFGGNSYNRSLLIHTDDAATQNAIRQGFLEEVFLHEGAHMALDHLGKASGWHSAQRSDSVFISEYARDYPDREDIAESFLPYFAVRHRPERLTAQQWCIMTTTMPNRLAYFDEQRFDMSANSSP